MRLTHVIAPGPIAGAENVVLQGTEALLERDHELSLLVLLEQRNPEHGILFAEEARARGIPTEFVPVRGRVDFRALGTLRAALTAHAPVVVHAHGYKALSYSLAARSGSASVAVTHHGETSHCASVRFYERVARALYRRSDRVFSVSRTTTEQLVARGIPRARVRTVPNPVALSHPSQTRPRFLGGGTELLFVGRLSEEKGLDVLLRALASPHVPTRLRLDVAGDGPCAVRWKALSSSLGIEHRVRWLGVRRDIPDLLDRADALVLPSFREGLPLAVLEAASSAVPVLASRVGGVPEAVWEGETGLLLPPGDVAAWETALVRWHHDHNNLRIGARRRAAEIRARHSPQRWAQLTTEHYRELARA